MPGQNAHEEDEGRSERDSEKADLSQSDTDRRDEGKPPRRPAKPSARRTIL